jgi:hypothetical protein
MLSFQGIQAMDEMYLVLDKTIKEMFPRADREIGLLFQINWNKNESKVLHNVEIIGDVDTLYKNPIPVKIEDSNGLPIKGNSQSIVIIKRADDNGLKYLIEYGK